MADASDLRAHRALDDVLALRHVVTSVAQVLGVSVSDLLARHAKEVDMASSLAQAPVLMDPMEEKTVWVCVRGKLRICIISRTPHL